MMPDNQIESHEPIRPFIIMQPQQTVHQVKDAIPKKKG